MHPLRAGLMGVARVTSSVPTLGSDLDRIVDLLNILEGSESHDELDV